MQYFNEVEPFSIFTLNTEKFRIVYTLHHDRRRASTTT